jgi:RNA polymerase sigma factor (sigma-70 family)
MVHDDSPDEVLYKRLIERDSRALEALIRRYSREMSYFTRLMLDGVGAPQDVEECINDLFVAIWQEIESFDPARGSLRTWMTMRAKYIALDRRRQVQRRLSAVTSLDTSDVTGVSGGEARTPDQLLRALTENNMEGLVEQRERRDELYGALEALSSLDRYLVYMRYFRLASTEEISAKTGLTRHAIDTRLWRARKQLRDTLEERTHERTRLRQEAQH